MDARVTGAAGRQDGGGDGGGYGPGRKKILLDWYGNFGDRSELTIGMCRSNGRSYAQKLSISAAFFGIKFDR